MSGNNSYYQFSPRPEAKAMNWDDLQPPLKKAVRELLVLIAGAKRISKEKQSVEQKPDIDSKETANCFLLHGARGAGKTTVLLSAKKAIFKPDDFFPEWVRKNISEGNAEREKMQEFERSEILKAHECVTKDELRHVVWLDLLDMEPLPADANLLAIVLTRVRSALEICDGVNRDSALTSIFEENTNSARHLLSGLIRDATLMWEDIKEADTRESANRQIMTADIYASFRKSFITAIEKLSKELGRPYGHDVRMPIILPFDNIDRSTEHLKSIVKLAELVSHPCLWLIMAGGREEISTYLERAYWKELISTHVGVGPLGRTDPKGEDETLAMARRQAAASAQKLWPSNHRIKLKPLKPEDVLSFSPNNDKDTLLDLFQKITILTWLDEPDIQTSIDYPKNKMEIKFIDFFIFNEIDGQPFSKEDIENVDSLTNEIFQSKSPVSQYIREYFKKSGRDIEQKLNNKTRYSAEERCCLIVEQLNKIVQESDFFVREDLLININLRLITRWLSEKKPSDKKIIYYRLLIEDAFPTKIKKSPMPLTRAARLALHLPARSVLDLWQLTYWVLHDPSSFPDDYHKAEKIARTMLRNLLSESKVPNKISKILHESIIHLDAEKGTWLNFKELEFTVECHAPYDTARSLYQRPPVDIAGNLIKSSISVRSSKESILIFKIKKEAQSTHRNEQCFNEELPALVAGWLAILYDILALSDKLAVINRPTINPPVMATTHGIVIEQEGFRKRYVEQHLKWPMPEWVTFLAYDIFRQYWNKFQGGYEKKSEMREENAMELHSRYLAVGWVCCVLCTFEKLTYTSESEASIFKSSIFKSISDCKSLSTDSIKNFEKDVMLEAAKLYSKIYPEVSKPYKYFDQDIMRRWLENELPLMLSYWYVPTSDRIPKPNKSSRFAEVLNDLNESLKPGCKELAKSWKENLPFIVAAMDDKLEKLFHEEAADKPDKECQRALQKSDEEYRVYLETLQKLCVLHHWPTATSGMEKHSNAS